MNIDCKKIDWENIISAPNFTDCFQNLKTVGKVVSVYDGDSAKIIYYHLKINYINLQQD